MKYNYEATIGGYSFLMNEPDTIEVWENMSGEHPDSYIKVKPGSIKDEKQFHEEISFWYLKNVG
jgi:hypothetical protein